MHSASGYTSERILGSLSVRHGAAFRMTILVRLCIQVAWSEKMTPSSFVVWLPLCQWHSVTQQDAQLCRATGYFKRFTSSPPSELMHHDLSDNGSSNILKTHNYSHVQVVLLVHSKRRKVMVFYGPERGDRVSTEFALNSNCSYIRSVQ